MDPDSEDKGTEEQIDIFVLPDGPLIHILSQLSWKDLLIVRLVSRSFYNFIHENYGLLNRKKLKDVLIKYDENCEECPFSVKLSLDTVRTLFLNPLFNDFNMVKTISFQNDEEMSKFLKMFDIRDLHILKIPVVKNIDIFDVLSRSLQMGTKIEILDVCRLEEKDFTSFRRFIEKLSSINKLVIQHICSPSAEAKDILSDLSLSSFDTIESFKISECHETKILSIDMVTDLFRKNPDLTDLIIGSMNIEFLQIVFKEFFTMEQPLNMRCKNTHNAIFLKLHYGGEIKHLVEILSNVLRELENVQELDYSPEPWRRATFVSSKDCKYCLKRKHKISKYVILCEDLLNC
uniref:F-box domain-containing protein n=2 Tax=Strongyloides papillosus TaxID=174720 RepID=A0A0N5BVC2_STREA